MMKRYIFLFSILCVTLVSCGQAKHKGETEIVFITTNDIHGRIDNFPKMAAYLHELKSKHTNVYVINTGDMFSGNPLIDNYPERGYPIVDLMNHVGYNLSTFGNHEFDYGQTELAARLKQANFPFILANATMSAELPQPEPYTVVSLGKVKVAFLGLIQVESNGTPATHPDRVKGITFDEPLKKAAEYKNLREKCDVFVALSHLGADTDVKLAEAMPEFDVILGGHSHTRIDTGMIVNGVLITQSESWLKYLGKTTIVVKNGKVISKHNELIDLANYKKEDAAIQKLIDKYKSQDPGKKIIGKNTSPIKGKHALGALMTDAVTKGLGLDIAFQNSGGVRIDQLHDGEISINDIYTLDPFGNEIIKVNMTYDEITSLLQNSTRKSTTAKPDLLTSGIRYTIYMNQDGKIQKTDLFDSKTGKLLDKKKTYSVGMNSYIYSKYKFDHADAGESLKITSADAVIQYITTAKTIDYSSYTQRETISLTKF